MGNDVQVELVNHVAVITIDRPAVRNAINSVAARRIATAFDELDTRRDVAAYVLTGGGGTFCAGMDLKAFLDGDVPTSPQRGFFGIVERPPRKPVVAAVEGYALAGGCEVALSCDLIVAAEHAIFGLPEVKRGLVASAGGLLRLPRRVSYHIAMEMVLTGDHYGAQRMYELGLVNRIAPPGRALEVALELADRIAANGPLAVEASKRVIVESGDWPAAEAFSRQREIVEHVFASKDATEGAAAFAEKRNPVWKGE
jgi:enoyl-CoA hydratase